MKTCDCGAELSANATTCPRCGRKFTSAVTWLVLWTIVGLVVLIGIGVAIN